MTNDELDALEKRLRERISGEIWRSIKDESAYAIAALRRELAAERERRIVYSPDALAMSDRVKQAEAERDAAIARAEKAELSVTEYELVRDVVLCDLGRDLNAAQAEVHELRELLREARPLLDCISKNSRLTTSRKLTGGHSKASTPRSRGRGKSDG